MIWRQDDCDGDLLLFVQRLLKLRQRLPDLFSPETPISETRPRAAANPTSCGASGMGWK